MSIKKNFGEIWLAVSTPLLVAIVALSLQHFWELLFESWKFIAISPEYGEGGEKIFLTVASLGVIFAAVRLRSYWLTQ